MAECPVSLTFIKHSEHTTISDGTGKASTDPNATSKLVDNLSSISVRFLNEHENISRAQTLRYFYLIFSKPIFGVDTKLHVIYFRKKKKITEIRDRQKSTEAGVIIAYIGATIV